MDDLWLCFPNNGDSLMADGACHYESFLSPNCLVSYNCSSSHNSLFTKQIEIMKRNCFPNCARENHQIEPGYMYIELRNFRVLFTDGN